MKPQIVHSVSPARHVALGAIFIAALSVLTSSQAQSFDAGSNGSLGDVVLTTNTTLTLPPDGKLHFVSLTVSNGVTLTFTRNAHNTPVFILAQSNVVVNGTINVDGGGRSANTGGLGGPGGFAGGNPGFGAEVPPGHGYGPGGGLSGNIDSCTIGAGGPHGGSYGAPGFSASGSNTYGNTLLIPLVGGSGGGGGQGSLSGGGGGGGALLIAANNRITLNGTVFARGGFGGQCNSGGSGGAIRLVAFRVEGSGILNTSSGSTPNRGFGTSEGRGRVRIDTIIRNSLNFNITGVSSVGGNLLVFPPALPTLTVTEAAGNTVPAGSDPVTFTLPFGSSTNRTIRIEARNFARNVPIRVTLTPDTGSRQIFDAEVDNTSEDPAFVDVPVIVPINTLVTVHCWTR